MAMIIKIQTLRKCTEICKQSYKISKLVKAMQYACVYQAIDGSEMPCEWRNISVGEAVWQTIDFILSLRRMYAWRFVHMCLVWIRFPTTAKPKQKSEEPLRRWYIISFYPVCCPVRQHSTTNRGSNLTQPATTTRIKTTEFITVFNICLPLRWQIDLNIRTYKLQQILH